MPGSSEGVPVIDDWFRFGPGSDDKWGEVVVAFVVPGAGAGLDPDDLRSFAQSRLARFKVPNRVHVVDQLPKTGTGRIQKYVLRKQAL